jgi:hypothetical protein
LGKTTNSRGPISRVARVAHRDTEQKRLVNMIKKYKVEYETCYHALDCFKTYLK